MGNASAICSFHSSISTSSAATLWLHIRPYVSCTGCGEDVLKIVSPATVFKKVEGEVIGINKVNRKHVVMGEDAVHHVDRGVFLKA